VSGPEFFQTSMGRTFFEATVPAIVRQLERLNENLERLVEVVGEKQGAEQDEPETEGEGKPEIETEKKAP
jgi:hypothetical protein